MHLIEAGTVEAPSFTLCLGDAVELLADVPTGSIDAIISDPPYPEVDRDYGRFTVDEWFALMRRVVAESRRVLKPRGSAVFVLQPNMERIGRMRPWLWEFMAEVARDWNMVQDAWWWCQTTLPQTCTIQGGLLRPSMKACVWLGDPDCRRYPESVLWSASDHTKAKILAGRFSQGAERRPSGHSVNDATAYAQVEKRGGVTPFNVLPIAASVSRGAAGDLKHPAATPPELCRFWLKYLTRPGDQVLDVFAGGGTVGEEAIKLGRNYRGFEQIPEYYGLASANLTRAFETHWDRAA